MPRNPGHHGHSDTANACGVVACAWEHFAGPNLRDDREKTPGLAPSLDALSSIDAPHAMPDSATLFGAIQTAVLVSDTWLDAVWVEVGRNGSRTLMHRAAPPWQPVT